MTPEQQLTALARHVRDEVQRQSEVKRRLMLGCACPIVAKPIDGAASTGGERPKLDANACSHALRTHAWRESACR
jgi:hypothetical protein